MKKISKVLSMVLVVGLIAAIPASTQIMGGSSIAAVGESDLPMLILVNRLELSEEQMNTLNGILSDLVDEKEARERLTAEFEEAMIKFNGTGEELDAMLAAFREDQQALAEALGESIESSLDEVRDLLSINQGIVLREQLPQLLGLDATQRVGVSNGQLRNAPDMMGNRMASSSMGRSGMMGQQQMSPQMSRGGQMQPQAQGRFVESGRNGVLPQNAPDMMGNRMASSSMGRSGMMGQQQISPQMSRGGQMQMEFHMDDCTGACEDESSSRMQGGFGSDATTQNVFGGRMGQASTNEDIDTMIEQRLGQDVDDETMEAMREQMQGRFEQMGDRVPEELMERFGERVSGGRESLDARLGQTSDDIALGQMGERANVTAMSRQGGMDQMVSRGQLDVNSISMQHMQITRGQLGDHGNLFEFLEQITDVLDLKLEAME